MSETPDTGAYMVAAYVLVAVILSIYTISLVIRARAALRR